MFQFNVDDAVRDACQVCCCEQVSIKPGNTAKVTINYAAWAVPIGRLHCNPTFDLVMMETCPANSNQPVVAEPVRFATPKDTLLAGDLTVHVTDPLAGVLTFKLLALYGPWHGALTMQPDGSFTYTPINNYTGEDRFYVTAKNSTGETTFEVMIGVGIVETTIVPTPHVSVDPNAVSINERYYTASFPIRVSPAADLCEVWRLTVLQNAIDCGCHCYNRTDCFDIRLVKC
jgi:hypothetical protein